MGTVNQPQWIYHFHAQNGVCNDMRSEVYGKYRAHSLNCEEQMMAKWVDNEELSKFHHE